MKKIIIPFILMIMFFISIMAYPSYATIENGLIQEESPSLIPVSGTNEATYDHVGKIIRRDNEADSVRVITQGQYDAVKDYIARSKQCSGPSGHWWDCGYRKNGQQQYYEDWDGNVSSVTGSHAQAWYMYLSWGVFTIEDYRAYQNNQSLFQSEMLPKVKVTDVFDLQLNSQCTISTLESYLNNSSSEPIRILKEFSSVFCIKHNQEIPTKEPTFGNVSSFNTKNYIKEITYDKNNRNVTDYDVITPIGPPTKTDWDYMEKDTIQVQSTSHNTAYFVTNKNDQDLRYNLYNGWDTYSSNVFSYATSFSQKLKPDPGYLSGNYNQERAQNAIWNLTGDGTSSNSGDKLFNAANSVDEFEALASSKGTNPQIQIVTGNTVVTSGQHVGESSYEPTGTTIGVNDAGQVVYKIGPFKMSSYALGTNTYVPLYSGSSVSVDYSLVGGIIYGELQLDNGKTVTIGHNVKDGEREDGTKKFKRKEDSEISSHAKIVYIDKTIVSTYDGTYLDVPSNVGESSYDYPYPESTFYIEVPVDSCGDAHTLESVEFYYRETSTDGHGWVISGKYAYCVWKPSDKAIGCTQYKTKCSHNTYTSDLNGNTSSTNCSATMTYEDKYPSVTISWNHTYSDGCGNACTGSCGSDSEGNPTSCGRCCDGSHVCSGSAVAKCSSHGYTRCQKFKWEYSTESTVMRAQPFLAIHDAKTEVDFSSKISELDVRLTTDVTIDKYIYKVEHSNENTKLAHKKSYTDHDKTYDSVFENNNRLNNKTTPVRLERGDRVTYKIVLDNDSNIKVQVQVKDILPDYCKFESVKLNGNTLDTVSEYTHTGGDGTFDDKKYFITTWVDVPANGEAVVTVTIIATASDATITNENTATMVSGNKGRDVGDGVDIDDVSVNYVRLSSGNGAVVNLAQVTKTAKGKITTPLDNVLQSSDYYTVKSYSVVLDKYITKVEHVTTGEVIYERYKGVKCIESSELAFAGSSANYKDRDKYNLDSSKETEPIVIEYGDRVTYDIDIQNTWSANNIEIDQKETVDKTINTNPYYAPNYAYVDITDTLPSCYEEGSLQVEYIIYETGKGNDTTGKNSTTNTPGETNYIEDTIELNPKVTNKVFTVPDLYINPNSEATLRVSYIVNTNKVGTLFENNVELNEDSNKGKCGGSEYGNALSYEIRNINNYYVYNTSNKSNTLRVNTSDYFILNDYNVDIETYITDYREEMLHQNAQTEEEYKTYEIESDNFKVEGLETWDGTEYDDKSKTRRRRNGNVYDLYDEKKEKNPVQVEKNETLQYKIRLYNNTMSESANDVRERETIFKQKLNNLTYYYKPATTVRTSSIKVTLDDGLALYTGSANTDKKVKATIYKSIDDADKKVNGNDVDVTIEYDSEYNVFYFNIPNKYNVSKSGDAPDKDYTLLQPGGVIEYTMDVQVVKSNMYLGNLENNAQIHVLTNVNNTMKTGDETTDVSYDEDNHSRVVTQRNLKNTPSIYDNVNNDIFTYPSSSDYVKLKDLIIAGRVWLDRDKNGYMGVGNDGSLSGSIKHGDSREIVYDDEKSEKVMEGIVVKLYKAGDSNPVAITRTNSQGLYTFAKDENMTFKPGLNQRIPRASGNSYIDYYVEFEYDGVTYKATEVYGGSNSLDASGQGNLGSLGKNWIQTENRKYYHNDYLLTQTQGGLTPGIYTYLKYNGFEDKITDENQKEKNLLHRLYENENYKYDSNAYEFKDVREKFNKNYETVTYNYAYATDGEGKASTSNGGDDLEFTKDGHTSYLNINHERVMKARSFIKRNSNASLDNTDELWLYYNKYTNAHTADGSNYLPETEYLKYINLGLEEREDIDISLTKDVYEVKTTINGEEMTYSYDQNQGVNGQMETDEYLQNYEVGKPYGLTLYESDFKYRAEQYKNQAVKDYKGEESELNIEVTYRIRIDSTKFEKDEPFMDDKDRELETTVHEIVDLYDENFVKYNDNPHEYIRLREKDEDNIFKEDDKEIKIAEAWCYDNGGNKVELTLSNSSKYLNKTEHATKDNDFTSSNNTGYNTLYITGMDTPHTKIDEGGHLDIYVKYVVDKDEKVDTREETIDGNAATVHTLKGELKIGNDDLVNKETENIAQINSYSIWYEDGKPTSIVDTDSNAGNVGQNNEGAKASPDDTTYYEDTVYKTEINITSPNSPNKPENVGEGEGELSATNPITPIRTITGKVWDDARTSETDKIESGKITKADGTEETSTLTYTNYSGDGLYNTALEKKPEAMANENVEKNYKDSSVTEKKDIEVRNAKVEYVEIVAMKSDSDADGDGKKDLIYYEEKLDKDSVTWEPVQEDRTEDDGTYELSGFIPGYYIVRYTYGDSINKESEPYDESTEEQKDMLIFNGQDYKSTKYTGTSDVLTEDEKRKKDEILATVTDETLRKEEEGILRKEIEDRIVKEMELKEKSDAKDDEIKRLETIAYSETMVNQRAEILKGLANGTVTDDNSNSTEQLKSLTDNTYMYADTVKFYVKPEKLETTTNPDKLDIRDAYKAYVSDGIAYSKIMDLEFEDTFVSSRTFNIKNLDLGIEYRPESQITLNKEVAAIHLITSDGEELVKLALRTINFGEGSLQEHEIIEEESIGLEYTQFISNDYTTINPYALTSEDYQGFIFINVDDDILQGSTIKIDYRFVAENNSEIDFVSDYLDTLRYRENIQDDTLYATYKNVFAFSNLNETVGTYNDLYVRDTNNKFVDVKTGSIEATDDEDKFVYTAAGTARNLLYEEYYDKDTHGSTYRKKELKTYDVTKDADGNQEKSDETQIQNKEVYYGRYLSKFYYLGEIGTEDVIASLKFDKVLDYVDTDLVFRENPAEKEKNKLWTTSTDNELKGIFVHEKSFTEQAITVSGLLDTTEELIDKQLVNSKGISYVTYQKDADNTMRPVTSNLVVSVDDRVTDDHNDNINESLSRFLLPYWEESGKSNAPDSRGNIILPVSKVISAETDTDDLQYENIAEVIQFTSQTGRRTNYATTIGNAAVSVGEFKEAEKETDTTATEVVTLTPPTGLDRLNRAVRNTVEVAGMGIGVTIVAVALVIGGFVIVRFTIKKIKKRRIK